MDLTVINIGDETAKGNRIIKLRHATDVTIAGLGIKQSTTTYYISMPASSVTAKQDEVLTDFPLDMFRVEEHPYVEADGSLPIGDDGEPICDEDGNPLQLKWLKLKS